MRYLILWITIITIVLAYTLADYADIGGLLMERADYLMMVEQGDLEYDPNIDEAIGIDIQNACEANGWSDKRVCELNYCFRAGVALKDCNGF